LWIGDSWLQATANHTQGSGMEYRILGPFEVSDNGRGIEIGGPKQRALLAVLLLHANEVVSRDLLIDELWGETPPATAVKTLHAHVSRLRKALNGEEDASTHGTGVLRTSGRGYLLRVERDQLDSDRVRDMLEHARRARGEGKHEQAAQELRRALAFWRGPALADFAYESFAQAEIARLDELQLTALEERIEADLALGRDGELVGELEALVARHPLRERLRGHLMLALYRSDRQAEALHVYQEGRLALAQEVGLEPSQGLQRLERRILEQDPVLAGPGRRERPRIGPAVSRRRPRPLVLAGLAALAVAVGAFQLIRDGGAEPVDGGDAAIASGYARALDPRTGEPLATVPLGKAPLSIAAGAGSVWVLDAEDRTVSQIDPNEPSRVRTFSTGSTPTDIAVGAGTLWIGNGFRDLGTALPKSVSRLDAESVGVDETIALSGRSHTAAIPVSQDSLRPHIAATRGAVWVINPDLTVSRISARTNEVIARVADVRAVSIAAGDGDVWVVDGRGELVEIDASTNRVSNRIEVAAASLTVLAVGAGAVWVADPVGGSVWRIDPEPEPILRSIPLGVGVAGIAFGGGAVWATNEVAGEVYRIDPRTNRARVVSRIASARGIAVGEGAVWVTAAPPRTSDAALPSVACSRVTYAGVGTPRFLIASDLPLHGPGRVATVPMVEAIRFVLERREFKAGRFSVGYQSCDDSTAQAGTYDPSTCFSNAKAYARNLDVIGFIGAYNSGCSGVQIPVANQAPDGPLAMISTSNTWNGLTRPYKGMRRGELEARYPSGERNYVRIAAADHLQSVANATLVKELGLRDLFVLSPDGDRYFTADVRTAARKLGLRIVGSAHWNTEASEFARLGRRIARTQAEAVFIAGFVHPHGGALVRDLRAQLGRHVALMAPDYFAPIPDLLSSAGPAAQGMYVSVFGVANNELPRRGRRLLEELEAASGREPSSPSTALYAAQATEILLDAIARSDGTRSSVTRELRRTSVEDGILGNIRFDPNGDLVEAPVTIFRVVGKRRGNSSSLPEFRGAVVDRVIMARAALLR
jgi:DNA-binding SARP family transcriptional activator/ABC-type branched-subunit amino acid transport system substrate-binding protein/DNA-binding beta-propeller fold protein YncE